MTPTAQRLYELLPAIYRMRDAARGEPLKALIEVLADQVAVIEEDLAQLYEDQFIETCAPWVAPYLGDLVGYRPVHGVVPRIASPRAAIANTIAYRRRKGTAAVLEQAARDVTGWHACVVEFFQRLATTQHMNHVRRGNRSLDLREWEPLQRRDTPFDRLTHTADVRRVAVGRGRYNIPNVGVFLWRLDSQPWTDATPARLDSRRYWFNPLGVDTPLFTNPEPKPEWSGLSTRMHVPDPIGRRFLAAYPRDYFGPGKSLHLEVDGRAVNAEEIVSCDLSDTAGGSWAQHPRGKIAIDPVLGRIAFPRDAAAPASVRVSFHHGFSAELGGGEYDRAPTIPAEFTDDRVWQVGITTTQPADGRTLFATLAEALLAWEAQPPGAVGVIALMDSGTLRGDLALTMPDHGRLLIVAAEWPEIAQPAAPPRRVPGRFNASGCRPHLAGSLVLRSAVTQPGALSLNGLLIEGAVELAPGSLAELSLCHCTLVPGRGFTPDGYPRAQREPSLSVHGAGARVEIDHCITGGLRVGEDVGTRIADSIIDATSRCGVAYSAPDGFGPAGPLHVENTTIIGKVHAQVLELASNTIFLARRAVHDPWPAPVLSVRRQTGCVRFSFVPPGSRTPRRFQCQPRDETDAAAVSPQFTSLRYGDPGYAQLSARCPTEIFRGADDESEMGAFHELYEPQRIANVTVRLEEYLRFGLEAGLFFEPRLASRPIRPSAYAYPPWVDLCGDATEEPLPGVGAGLL